MTGYQILSRLFKDSVKPYTVKLSSSFFFMIITALTTGLTAWILDPAIKKIFVEQDKSMLVLIPLAIVLAFTVKGVSLYFARTILIKLGNEIVRVLQLDLSGSVLKSDTHTLESKHSGRYLQHFMYDVSLISNLVATGALNLMKDSLALLWNSLTCSSAR